MEDIYKAIHQKLVEFEPSFQYSSACGGFYPASRYHYQDNDEVAVIYWKDEVVLTITNSEGSSYPNTSSYISYDDPSLVSKITKFLKDCKECRIIYQTLSK